MLKRKEILILCILLLAGFLLRIHNLDDKSYWGDEANTIDFVEKNSFWNILTWQSSKTHPPVYFVLFKLWATDFGEFHTRLLSVLAGVLGIFLIYLLGKKMFDVQTGLMSAFLIALNTRHVYISQEIRMYAFMFLFSICSMYYFVCVLEEDKRKNWILYGLFTFLVVFTHYFGAFIPFIQGVYLFFNKRKYIMKWLMIQVPFGLLYLYGVSRILNFYAVKVIPFKGGQLLDYQHLFRFFIYGKGWHDAVLILFILCIVLFAFGIKNIHDKTKLRLLLLWIFLPIGLAFIISTVYKPFFYYRYLYFIAPPCFILISRGVFKLKRWRVIALIIVVLSVPILAVNYDTPKADWKVATAYIEAEELPGDIIVVNKWAIKAFWFYYHGNSSVYHELEQPDLSQFANYSRIWLITETELNLSIKPIREKELNKTHIALYVNEKDQGQLVLLS